MADHYGTTQSAHADDDLVAQIARHGTIRCRNLDEKPTGERPEAHPLLHWWWPGGRP